MRRLLSAGAMLMALLLTCGPATAGPTEALVKRIKAVGGEGAGNTDAAAAWKELVALGPDALLEILAAIDEREVVPANWLRTAVDAIGEKALRDGKKLPAEALEKFARQTRNGGAARRLAYEWLTKADKTAPARLLPDMLTDPSPELRRDAVALALTEAETKRDRRRNLAMAAAGALCGGAEGHHFLKTDEKPPVLAAFRKALRGACDPDQVDIVAKALKPLGVEVDLASHFGFVRRWQLVAPFDNAGGIGFKMAYPPEKSVDLKAVYKGKGGDEVRWVEHICKDRYGVVDLNKILFKKSGVIGYAYAVIDSPEEKAIDLRAGSWNALKMFLNGKEVFGREEYHHGMGIDQHIGHGVLKKGRNVLLLKVCQNEQSEVWAQSWSFQLRLCDATGVAVPFTQPE